MAEQELIAGCGTDVLVSFAESLHIYTGLLTVAAVCGGLSGILAAALLYVFCLKPLLLTRQVSKWLSVSVSSHYIHSLDVYSHVSSLQGYNARRLLEPDDGELDNNQSDCVSNSRKEAPSATTNDKVLLSLTFKTHFVWDLYRWMSLLHEIYTSVNCVKCHLMFTY